MAWFMMEMNILTWRWTIEIASLEFIRELTRISQYFIYLVISVVFQTVDYNVFLKDKFGQPEKH